MSKVVVNISLTLDGVMQSPDRPDEDRRGGLEHGGWALPYNGVVIATYRPAASTPERSTP
jgi:hypothetical protein